MTAATDTPRRKPGRPRDPAASARILEAARYVTADQGIAACSMSAIADQAGVGKPTIYLRFPDRGAVLDAADADVRSSRGRLGEAAAEVRTYAEKLMEDYGDDGLFLLERMLVELRDQHRENHAAWIAAGRP